MNNERIFITSISIFTDSDAWGLDYDNALESTEVYFLIDNFFDAKNELSIYLQNFLESLKGNDFVVNKLSRSLSDAVEVLELENDFYGEYISYSYDKEEFLMNSDLGNQNISITIQEASVDKEKGYTKLVVKGKHY